MYKYDKLKLITMYVRLRWRKSWYEHTRKSILTMENDVREDIYTYVYSQINDKLGWDRNGYDIGNRRDCHIGGDIVKSVDSTIKTVGCLIDRVRVHRSIASD